MKKILIDTDIGDDIDDSLALAFALSSPAFQVMGITTCFRNVEARARLVYQLLGRYGRTDIPVAPGIARPLLEKADIGAVPVLCDEETEICCPAPSFHAVQLIIETVRTYPDVAVVALGPLTNLACAVRLAPDIMESADIWMMGGMYSEPYPEWNISRDPEAAAIVLESCKNLHMVGLDVTLQCRMAQAQLEGIARLHDEKARFLLGQMRRWMAQSNHLPIFHDPLVLAALAQPGILTFQPKCMQVECCGQATRGITAEKTDPFRRRPQQANAQVAVAVDERRFNALFMATVFPGVG